MNLYDRLGSLPLTIEGLELELREAETTSGFTRTTTVVTLSGDGVRGRGEDVIYDAELHHAIQDEPPSLPFDGIETVDDLHRALENTTLVPAAESSDRLFEHFRQWAFESAALDLALSQAGTSLAATLDRSYRPVRFVVSTLLGEPPSFDRVERLLASDGDLEFKLDPTDDWTEPLIDRLAGTGAVRILDLKGMYDGLDVGHRPNEQRYQRLFSAFPDAVIEDPAVSIATEDILADEADRIAWDYPIRGPDSVDDRPWQPRWLNIKPSRFGSLEALCATLELADERGINLYGGGQFELDVGREHLHAIASVFYPDGPNDVAPAGYNLAEATDDLPTSPLTPPADPSGLSWS